MKLYAIIGLGLTISVALLLAVIQGVEPKPILKMKPNSFSRPEEIGAVVYRRMRQEVRESKVLLLNSSPWVNHYERIWKGFLLTAEADQLKPGRFLEQLGLSSISVNKPSFQAPEKIDFLPADLALFTSPADTLQMPNPKTVAHLLFQHGSHFFDQSVTHRFTEDRTPFIAFTLLPFAVEKKNLDDLYPPCDPDEIPSSALNQLGCAARRASKAFFRKKLDPTKIWALLEQHGQRDLYLFVYFPSSNGSQSLSD